MKIKALVVGPIMENCYILYDEQTLEGIIVDPGDEAISILNVVDNLKLHIKYIVNTHGHADHIGANKELGLALKAKLAIHTDDACMLTDPHLNLSENGYIYLCSYSSWKCLYFSTNISRKLIIRNPQDTQIILVP